MARNPAASRAAARACAWCCAAWLLASLPATVALAQAGNVPNNPLRSAARSLPVTPLRVEPEPFAVRQASAIESPPVPPAEEELPLKYKTDEWLNPEPGVRGPPLDSNYLDEELEILEQPIGPLRRMGRWATRPFISLVNGRFYHGEPNDPDRYTGRGGPMTGTSWLNRPISAGLFAGGLFGDEPFDGRVKQGAGFLGGFRFGYDFDHYWGTELRVGLSQLELYDILDVPLGRTSKVGLFDLNLMYYPWGDSRVRPYLTGGLGVAAFNLYDEQQRNYNDALLLMPLGVGMKFYHHPWSVWRIDVLDNLTFGHGGIHTMHNFSISAGWEIRFGGQPRLYFPAHPGVNRW